MRCRAAPRPSTRACAAPKPQDPHARLVAAHERLVRRLREAAPRRGAALQTVGRELDAAARADWDALFSAAAVPDAAPSAPDWRGRERVVRDVLDDDLRADLAPRDR